MIVGSASHSTIHTMHAKVDRKVKSVTTEFIPRHSTYILFGNCDTRAIAMMITTL